MYVTHELLSTPPDDTKLWRYLDLSQFLWLLASQSLYFANVLEFPDKWEGHLSVATIEGIKRWVRETLSGHSSPPELSENQQGVIALLSESLKSLQQKYGICCWHKNQLESVAMWKLYTQGKDGVAIQTTVGRLKECLSKESRPIYVASVRYGHEAIEGAVDEPDPLIPITTKRRSFEHESEVRLILELVADFESPRSSTGTVVSVDLDTLIERIVVSPEYPAWAIPSLQERISIAGLAVRVETSDLLKLPEPI
jgi:hypothetical protein